MVNEDQSMDESNVDDTWSSDDIQPEPSTTDKLKHLAIPVGIVGVVLAAVILWSSDAKRRKREWTMRFFDLLIMSINNLRRRKLRTGLTVLGVVIGTAPS